MIFFYGRKSFNARTVLPFEIGVYEPLPDIVQFELRQQYAHLYWIPMFSMGTMWCARKSDDKLYEVNDTLANTLNTLPRKKLGWVAFLGPIVIALIILVAKISG